MIKRTILLYGLGYFLLIPCFSQSALMVEYHKRNHTNAKVDYHKIDTLISKDVYSLTFQDLNKPIPNNMNKFSTLKTLELIGSELGEFLPSSLFSLPELMEISILDTRMHKIPKDISMCTSLEYLRIRGSCLDSVPKEVFELPKLKSLSLTGNRIAYIDTNFNPQLSGIERLYLNSNSLKYLPTKLLKLPRLKTLSLSYNQLDTVDLRIDLNSNIYDILLNNNQIKYFAIDVSLFKNLNFIHLMGNPLDSLSITGYEEKRWMPVYVRISSQLAKKLFGAKTLPWEKGNLVIEERGDLVIKTGFEEKRELGIKKESASHSSKCLPPEGDGLTPDKKPIPKPKPKKK